MAQLSEVIFNAPLFGPRRKPESEDDFGDKATVGLQVKARKPFPELGDHDFGFYLGCYQDKFHIGTHEIGVFRPTKLVSFDSMEDLQRKWCLD